MESNIECGDLFHTVWLIVGSTSTRVNRLHGQLPYLTERNRFLRGCVGHYMVLDRATREITAEREELETLNRSSVCRRVQLASSSGAHNLLMIRSQ